MEQWEINKIREEINALKKEEVREFMVAYSELDPKYHGYLQALPQKVKIWFKAIDSDFSTELKKEHGWDKIWAADKGLFFTITKPYLGIDGCLAMLHDKYENEDVSVNTEIIETETKLVVKAIIKAGNKSASGNVDIPYILDKEGKIVYNNSGKPLYDNIEIPTSTAVRKALTLMGIGRFPISKTEYGDHDLVIKFREFVESQRNG